MKAKLSYIFTFSNNSNIIYFSDFDTYNFSVSAMMDWLEEYQ